MSGGDQGKLRFAFLDAGPNSTVVVEDKELPIPSEGRIYLYNLKRDAIVEYAEGIVRAKLRPLEAAEQPLAKDASARYVKAAQQFLKQHKEWQESLRHRWPQDEAVDVPDVVAPEAEPVAATPEPLADLDDAADEPD